MPKSLGIMIIAEAHATRCKFLNGIQTTLSTFAGWGEFADVEGSLFDLSATTSRKALLGPSICRAARLVSSRLVLFGSSSVCQAKRDGWDQGETILLALVEHTP